MKILETLYRKREKTQSEISSDKNSSGQTKKATEKTNSKKMEASHDKERNQASREEPEVRNLENARETPQRKK